LHAQGATEYLIVLGVVLIIGLVSVSLLSYFPGTARDATATASNAYWQGQARPLKVQDIALTNDSTFVFGMENVEADPLYLTGIGIDGASAAFGEQGAGFSNTSSIYFGPGENKLVEVSLGAGNFNCVSGQAANMKLSFVYQTSFGTTKTESSDNRFVLKCNMDSGNGGSSGAGGPLAITTSSIPVATEGDSGYRFALKATGGTPPYTWRSMTDPGSPSGWFYFHYGSGRYYLSSDGTITYGGSMPDLRGNNTYTSIINVTDSAGNWTTKSLSISIIQAPAIAFGSISVPAFYEGTRQTMHADSTGTPTVTYSVSGIPAGCTVTNPYYQFAANCLFGPGTAGQYSLVISATDASNPSRTGNATVPLEIRVAQPLQFRDSYVSPVHIPVNIYYSDILHVNGGYETFAWNVNTPAGLTAYAGNGRSVDFRGTLTGTYNVTAAVTDSQGASVPANFTIIVDP